MRRFLAERVAATHLFAAGAAVMLSFVLHDLVAAKAVQVALFAALAMAAGRRVRWGFFAAMVCGVCFFHLLSPHGKILLVLGPLTITQGALTRGLLKGLTVTGVVLLSLFSVRRDLVLPGRAGRMLSEVLYYYELLLQRQHDRPGAGAKQIPQLMARIDEALLRTFPLEGPLPGEAPPQPGGPARTSAGGAALLAGLVAANWAVTILALL